MSDDGAEGEAAELATTAVFVLAIGIQLTVAYLGLSRFYQLRSTLLMACSIGLLVGVLAAADEDTTAPKSKRSLLFVAVGAAALLGAGASLALAPFLPIRFRHAVYAGTALLGAGLSAGHVAEYLDSRSAVPEGVPDDPESILDDGGDT